MRKIVILITALAITFSGLALSPAQAVGTYDSATGDGTVECTTGDFVVSSFVVTSNNLCTGIATIPRGVTRIGQTAFNNASSLVSVVFESGSNVQSIGNAAFWNTALTSIHIPASLNLIDFCGFCEMPLLTSITVDSGNLNFSSIDGVLFNKSVTSIEVYPASKNVTTYAVPTSVTTIEGLAFEGATLLTSITLPAGVTSIETRAFSGTTSLTSINIPAGVTSIGSSAFGYATSLTSITIPAGVTSIGSGTFNGATSLTSVIFAQGSQVTSIGRRAFQGTTSLTTITIPSGVTFIGEEAFEGATALASFYFLRSDAPTVDDDAFVSVAGSAKAYIKSRATGFDTSGTPPRWNGLEVAVGVYTVSYNTNSGSSVSDQGFVGNISEPATPTRAGHTLAGWSTTDGGSVLTFPYTPPANSDVTLFAKWTEAVASVVTPVPNAVTPISSSATSKATPIKLAKFNTSSSKLTGSQKTALKNLVSKSAVQATFVITGTAGKLPGVSDPSINALALKRGKIVKAYLVKLGVSRSRITIQTKITNQGIVPKTKILTNNITS